MIFYKKNNQIMFNYKLDLEHYVKDFKIQKFINKFKECVNNLMKNQMKFQIIMIQILKNVNIIY